MTQEEKITQLEQKVQELEKLVNNQNLQILVLQKLNEILRKESKADKATVEMLRSRITREFQSSTEQLYLFDEVENTAALGALEETPEDAPVEVKSYVRRKARTTIELPSDTPVVDIYDDARIETCDRCGAPMKQVGEKVYETFTRITTQVVIRTHEPQFACTSCEPEEDGERIVQTPVTGNMLDGTVCDPTLLSQIIENKFSYAQPLYRQALAFKDINLSRFTMSAWIMKVGNRLVDNLYPCLEKQVYSYPLINMDETPLQVLGLLGEDGKRKAPHSRANAFMVVRAAVDEQGRNGPVLFTFTDNRRNETLSQMLRDYHGIVQTDGLYGYETAQARCGFTHLGCLVHARRKAVEANGNRTSGHAYELLKLYEAFFHKEGELKGSSVEERREVLLPLLDAIKSFCLGNVNNAIGKLRTAFEYPLERWDTLVRFLDYPFATSSNQRAENAIRPFTVGRKNWLFNITESGAEVSALFYSLVETCKSMDINFQDYMTYVLLHANNVKDGDVEGWMKFLPGNCDISEVREYRERLRTAKPDPDRTESYRLRGKRV